MSLSKETQKDRWVGIAIGIIIVLIISFIPISSASWFEFHCPHRLLFGFGCPLCGSTRALISVIHLEFYNALLLNAAVYSLLLFGVFEMVNLLLSGKFEKARRWLIASVIISYLVVYGYRLVVFLLAHFHK